MNRCSKCKEFKNSSCFHKDASHSTGVNRNCKSCRKMMNADYVKEHKVYKAVLKGYSASRVKRALSCHTPIIPRIKIDIATPGFSLMIDRLKLSTPIDDYSASLTVGDWDAMSETEQKLYV